jgi:glucoamylase
MRTYIAPCAALVALACALLGGGAAAEEAPQPPPGLRSFWTYAGKTGVGTSYEAYTTNGQYADDGPTDAISRVWFSLAEGIVTETAHGLVHEAQIRDLQFLVTGNGFFDE